MKFYSKQNKIVGNFLQYINNMFSLIVDEKLNKNEKIRENSSFYFIFYEKLNKNEKVRENSSFYLIFSLVVNLERPRRLCLY